MWDSELWTRDWFGSFGSLVNGSAPADADELDLALTPAGARAWAIQDGRFAFFAPRAHDGGAGASAGGGGGGARGAGDALPAGTPRNAYGLLRAPWNNNPSPCVLARARRESAAPRGCVCRAG